MRELLHHAHDSLEQIPQLPMANAHRYLATRWSTIVLCLFGYQDVLAEAVAPYNNANILSATSSGNNVMFSGSNVPLGVTWSDTTARPENQSISMMRIHRGGHVLLGTLSLSANLQAVQQQSVAQNRMYLFGYEVGRTLADGSDEAAFATPAQLRLDNANGTSYIRMGMIGNYANDVEATFVGVSVGQAKTGVGGQIDIAGNLDIAITAPTHLDKNGLGQYKAVAYGIHVYGAGSKIDLANTTIKISGHGHAILLGVVQEADDIAGNTPRGPGEIVSRGVLNIDATQLNGAAIGVVHQGVTLDANGNNSKTSILASGSVIDIAQPLARGIPDPVFDDPAYNPQMVTAFNNAQFSTTSTTATLINVQDNQKNYQLSVRGNQSNVIAADAGWLIDVGRDSDTRATFKEGARLQGMVNQAVVGATLNMQLQDDGTVWTLAQKGADKVSTFSQLTIENNAALDASKALAGGATAYVLNGDVVAVNKGTLNLSSAQLALLPGGMPQMSNGAYVLSSAGRAGDVLTVNGTYTTNGGVLVLDTVLGDDNSLTDKFVFQDTAGNGVVRVHNAGGMGDVTQKGIKIIEVTGASNALFVKDGRVVAGAHEYELVRYAGENDWYLTNLGNAVNPPVVGIGPAVQRPESGSYLANYLAANTMFNMQLHDRLGEAHFTNGMRTGNDVHGMWGRIVGGQGQFNDGSGQIETDTRRVVMQVGADVARWGSDASGRTHLGVMGGYGTNDATSTAGLSGYASRAKAEGYHAGVYGTWFAKGDAAAGAYVDTWVMYSHFKHRVSGDAMPTERYNAKGWNASVETGYAMLVGQSDNTDYYLQPKAQFIVMGVGAPAHQEANGTVIVHQGGKQMQSRLGVRMYTNRATEGSATTDQMFVEGGWIRNHRDMAIDMNATRSYIADMRDVGEVKLGIEASASRTVHWWAGAAYRFAQQGFSDAQLMAGVKKLF